MRGPDQRGGVLIFELPSVPIPVTSFVPAAPSPLDVAHDATFDAWCATPIHDTRTLAEFAADGGFPLPPE